jgi:CubicO group peptidase (beta-lactamase class C family)
LKLKIKQNKLIITGIILILILFLAILIQGCSGQSGSQGFHHPDGAELEAILQDFEQYAEKSMDDWQIPGMAIAIIRGDEVIYSKGLGVKKLGESVPVTENTIFQIGSTSKAFTATLVAMLVDEGLVDWEDRVIDHLPDFAMYDPEVTQDFRVKDLMSQRSGMPGYSGDELSYFGYSREHIINCIRHIKPVSDFRSKYAYQNHLFLVAAELIEEKTGKTWEQNVQERIFNPLGMNNSSTDTESFKSEPDVTWLHKMENDEVIAIPMDDNLSFSWLDIYSPAGGINSNLVDMVKWIKFNYRKGRFNNEQLVSRRNMDYLHMAHTFITDTPSHSIQSLSYCQAWVLTGYKPYKFNWHTGATSGCATVVAFASQADIGIVVLSNRVTGLPQKLSYYFFDRYFDNPEVDWSAEALEAHNKSIEEEKKNRPVPPENPEPSLSLASYVGEYANIIVDKMSVDIVDGKLVMTIGPAEVQYILNHFDANVFLGEDYNFVTFATDAENNVISAELDLIKVMDDNVLIKQ